MIDYTKPWHVLDISTSNAIRPDFDFDSMYKQSEFLNKPGAVWNFADESLEKLFTKDWLKYIDSLGFKMRNALLFYRQSGYVHPLAHIDYVGNINPRPAIYALNFVITPNDDSAMVWYHTNNCRGVMDTEAEFGNEQNHYEFWPMEQLVGQEITSKCIGNQMTLVNTGIIHNVIVNQQSRLAVSIRLVSSDQIQTWTDAVNFFSPWIKKND